MHGFANLGDLPRAATHELTVDAGAGPVAISPDEKFLAVGTIEGGEVRLYTIDPIRTPNNWKSICLDPASSAECRHCVQICFGHGFEGKTNWV